MSSHPPPRPIRIRGARQNNLKNLDVDLHTGEFTVVTGVSGSGKSSLVFDTLYAEGQRRYVETFSTYARQFLERMDKPAVDAIDGVPPAIAIDQTNPVRTSRSTVGTMTELNDHLKLWFARAAQLFDRHTAQPVRQDSAQSIFEELQRRCTALGLGDDARIAVTFAVELPADTPSEQMQQWLSSSGFTKVQAQREREGRTLWDVVVDRFRWQRLQASRAMEAIDLALQRGAGQMALYVQKEGQGSGQGEGPELGSPWHFSTALHCPESGVHYRAPQPALFSFNSAVGACATCRGFGRVIGVDWDLVIPDPQRTLRAGAIKAIQTPAWQEVQGDLMRHGEAAAIALDTPWQRLSPAQQHWVLEGQSDYRDGQWARQWYGIRRFFQYLQSKSYKMHIRVLLSKYRSYTPCPDCAGARLHSESLLWRIGTKDDADAVLLPQERFMPVAVGYSRAQLEALPGLCLHDVMRLPLDRLQRFFERQPAPAPGALPILHREISTRLRYLCDVGIGYLTLDRQSRTLSGGEVQRINLTTALGTSLVNTLFVLDEPSIGLHPRDMQRIIQAMQRLVQAGNTLVAVEHDPAVMGAAQRIIDMGPGPGALGGQVVFDGTPAQLCQADTLTGHYLSGRRQVASGLKRLVTQHTARLTLQGVQQHNLRGLTVGFPLQCWVTVTGVSGSGKSTLIQDVLAPALLRHFGQASAAAPAAYKALLGAQHLSGVCSIDQSPIGKTARSNPVSYVGAWDKIRTLLAQTPLARERGYSASHFSFNAGHGRCPSCGGSGSEHIEMQFLSDVYLRCPDCQGQRYRPEVLEVAWTDGTRGLNAAQILQLTVSEALQVFAAEGEVLRALQPLVDVGLHYLQLGQSVPTLSGGEAQRLKLAGFLGQAARARTQATALGQLFLLDEPTTGLHFDDIAKLMRALRKLIDAGHSVIVIEHNVDVIRASDWLIDLGPEGGEHGGQLVAEGPPEALRSHPHSHTARALREYEAAMHNHAHALASSSPHSSHMAEPRSQGGHPQPPHIQILNAREHNLQALTVCIPRTGLNVITGVSGSGKSTLAFDILFNEGQRRYLESLNAYARAIVQPAGRPEVDAVYGIAPTVAIEQRLSRGGRKSTVGTTTEVWHFLRLLYVKLGVQHCIHDGSPVRSQTPQDIVAQLFAQYRGQFIGLLAPLVIRRKGVYTEWAEWARSRGYTHLRVDGEFVPTEAFPRLDRFREHSIELPIASVCVQPQAEAQVREYVARALELGKGMLYVLAPLEGLAQALQEGRSSAGIGQVQGFSTLHACPQCATSYPALQPRMFSYNSAAGWCPDCVGTGVQLNAEQRRAWVDAATPPAGGESVSLEGAAHDSALEQNIPDDHALCPSCQGTRLNATARAVRFAAQGIADIAQQPIYAVLQWLNHLSLTGREGDIARDVVPEIRSRLEFLCEVGLSYLTLDRAAPTLSGGEAQRIRLAAQLGSRLQGVCYVLDEPTIGLHPRDNQMLLGALQGLAAQGNTLVVVEHDESTLRAADHLIDIGPGAGRLGGRVVAQGTVADLQAAPDSLTGRYLRHAIAPPLQPRRAVLPLPAGQAPLQWLQVQGAYLHNLQSVDVAVPLRRLVAVTGVSGSGKSTLARDVLVANVAARLAGTPSARQGCRALLGVQGLQRVLEVDQTPIGKTPRSCAATYVGVWDAIRKLFAQTLEARTRGYSAGRFSFNAGAGRCPECQGQGQRTIAMSFLPDVKIVCPTCQGARFEGETLSVTWRGKNVAQVLGMAVDEAVDFFASMPNIAHPLQLLHDVGLGYLTLGQPSPTLSGGEAQRIKLVTELAKVREDAPRRGTASAPHTLYVLDEPTVGLHMANVHQLIGVLHRLVDTGHSVIVIEHDLDLIAQADWVIDLGPEGGAEGGRVVAVGPPQTLAQQDTHTGRALRALWGRTP